VGFILILFAIPPSIVLICPTFVLSRENLAEARTILFGWRTNSTEMIDRAIASERKI
jgi:hypothetical protein